MRRDEATVQHQARAAAAACRCALPHRFRAPFTSRESQVGSVRCLPPSWSEVAQNGDRFARPRGMLPCVATLAVPLQAGRPLQPAQEAVPTVARCDKSAQRQLLYQTTGDAGHSDDTATLDPEYDTAIDHEAERRGAGTELSLTQLGPSPCSGCRRMVNLRCDFLFATKFFHRLNDCLLPVLPQIWQHDAPAATSDPAASSLVSAAPGDLEWCRWTKLELRVTPGQSWGGLSEAGQAEWKTRRCDRFFCRPNANESIGAYRCVPLPDGSLAANTSESEGPVCFVGQRTVYGELFGTPLFADSRKLRFISADEACVADEADMHEAFATAFNETPARVKARGAAGGHWWRDKTLPLVPSSVRVLQTLLSERWLMRTFSDPAYSVLIVRKQSRRFHDDAAALAQLQEASKMAVRFYLGSESLADTVALFARASAVVGYHGAGHVNAVFGPANLHVIEISTAFQSQGNSSCMSLWRTNTLPMDVNRSYPAQRWDVLFLPLSQVMAANNKSLPSTLDGMDASLQWLPNNGVSLENLAAAGALLQAGPGEGGVRMHRVKEDGETLERFRM